MAHVVSAGEGALFRPGVGCAIAAGPCESLLAQTGLLHMASGHLPKEATTLPHVLVVRRVGGVCWGYIGIMGKWKLLFRDLYAPATRSCSWTLSMSILFRSLIDTA